MKTKSISIIVIIAIASIISVKLYLNKQELNDQASIKEVEYAIPVKIENVKKQSLSQSFVTTGEFEGLEEVILIAESQGSIQYLKFKEGDKVLKGQVIAKIDAVSLNSQMASLQSNLEKARTDVARFERLEKSGAVSKAQLEDANLKLESIQSNIAQTRQQLSFTTVKSPIDGIVNEIMVEETSFVMPGNQIAQIVRVDKLKLITMVSESDLSMIEEGQLVQIQTEVYPLKTIEGKVSNISVKADQSKKFKVTIEVNQTASSKKLRSGMFAEAQFGQLKGKSVSTLMIPRKALVGSMQNASIYVVENKKAVLKKIKIGSKINDQVIVLSGIEEGDQIVTTGMINLKNMSKVNIIK